MSIYIYKHTYPIFCWFKIIIFPHEHPPSSDVHLKELAARAPQTAAAGLGLGERQMFPQHLQGSRSKVASWKSYSTIPLNGTLKEVLNGFSLDFQLFYYLVYSMEVYSWEKYRTKWRIFHSAMVDYQRIMAKVYLDGVYPTNGNFSEAPG